MTERLRVAVVADVHYGDDGPTKKGRQALELLEGVVREVNEWQPDLVVDLGDRLNESTPELDRERLTEVREVFQMVRAPRVHLLGNHDIENLSRRDSEDILGMPMRHGSLDINGWHLVFWYADCSYVRKLGNLSLAPADLQWLEADLKSTRLPTVVFTHVPLADGSMVGNYYFERNPHSRAGYSNAHLARAIIERSGRVVMALAGHVHWNSLNTIDGAHYVTVQSLTETFTTPPHPAGAWAQVELGSEATLRVLGRDPLSLTLPRRQAGQHWLTYGGRANPVSRRKHAEEILENEGPR